MASLLEMILRDKMLLWRLFHHHENSDLDGDHFEVGSKSRSDLAISSPVKRPHSLQSDSI